MPHVAVLNSDMIFSSRVVATARQAGWTSTLVRSPTELAAALLATPTDLLIVDLELKGLSPVELVRCAGNAAPGCPIIAYLPHVRTDLATDARAAGLDRVLARSAFVERLPALFAERADAATAPRAD